VRGAFRKEEGADKHVEQLAPRSHALS